MKKSFKRTLALVLCILMIFSSFSLGVYAVETPENYSLQEKKASAESIEDTIDTLNGVIKFLKDAESSTVAGKVLSVILPEDTVEKLSDAVAFLEKVVDFIENGPSSNENPPADKEGIENLKDVSDILDNISSYIGNIKLTDVVAYLIDRLVPTEIKEAAQTIRDIAEYLEENTLLDLAGDVVKNIIPSDTLDALDVPLEVVGIIKDALVTLFGSGFGSLQESGIVGYLYDPSENCFYTASDPWQRSFGYNMVYDGVSPFGLIIFDTVRFKFKYAGKDWMIQMWKGQYGAVFYGAEIGLYNKPEDRFIDHYDCASDSDLLKMSFDFYQYEKRLFKEDTWEKKFSRPHIACWWSTGFIPGNMIGRFNQLRMTARITAKDYDMLNAFTRSIQANGMSYETNGLDVILTY